MTVIANQQVDVPASESEPSYVAALIARLCRELPILVSTVPAKELRRQVEDAIKAAQVLEINNFNNLYRFLRLRYLPVSIWERAGAEEMMVRVLTDPSVDAERRLSFVETCIAQHATQSK